MKQYEITFIVDPVLSGDEIKATAQTYVDHLKNEGCEIVHMDEMGLRQLAYPINNRTSGIYSCVEFKAEDGSFIDKLELALRRDERIMRFLTVKLDKFGIKYNDDKRNGKIGTVKKKKSQEDKRERRGRDRDRDRDQRRGDRNRSSQQTSGDQKAPTPKPEAPAPKPEAPAPKSEAPAPKSEAPAPKSEAPASKPEAPVVTKEVTKEEE